MPQTNEPYGVLAALFRKKGQQKIDILVQRWFRRIVDGHFGRYPWRRLGHVVYAPIPMERVNVEMSRIIALKKCAGIV